MVTDKMVGRRWGKVVVITRERSKSGNARVRIRCDCGVEKVVGTANLTSGRIHSCGCGRRKKTLFGESVTVERMAELTGLSYGYVCRSLRRESPETFLRKHNEEAYLRLKLTKTKKRGRPLKTTDGREISHEEFLRGLVQHQAIKEAS